MDKGRTNRFRLFSDSHIDSWCRNRLYLKRIFHEVWQAEDDTRPELDLDRINLGVHDEQHIADLLRTLLLGYRIWLLLRHLWQVHV